MVKVYDKLFGKDVVDLKLLFYVQFMCFACTEKDYVTLFVKNLCFNFVIKSDKILKSVLFADFSKDHAMFKNCCRNLSEYLLKWYDFQEDVCDMLSCLCLYTTEKLWIKHMVMALKKKNDQHTKLIESTIETILNSMVLTDAREKTLKKVQKSFDNFHNSQQLLQDMYANTNFLATETELQSDMAYVNGLLLQIEDIKNGKLKKPEEVSAVRRLLFHI
jgi:hypothetical protein